MSLRHHEIAEANHRILDPFTDEKLRLLGEVARVGPGTRILDLACGKGEMLCRWAEWFGSGGVAWTCRTCSWRRPMRGPRSWAWPTGSRSCRATRRPTRRSPELRHRVLPGRDVDRGRPGRDDGAAAAGDPRRRAAHRGRAVLDRGAAGRGVRGVGVRARRVRVPGRDRRAAGRGGPGAAGDGPGGRGQLGPLRGRSGGRSPTGWPPTRTTRTTPRCAGSWTGTGARTCAGGAGIWAGACSSRGPAIGRGLSAGPRVRRPAPGRSSGARAPRRPRPRRAAPSS